MDQPSKPWDFDIERVQQGQRMILQADCTIEVLMVDTDLGKDQDSALYRTFGNHYTVGQGSAVLETCGCWVLEEC